MKNNLFPLSFFVGFIIVVIGAYFKIMHNSISDFFLITGLIISTVSLIIGIYEIATSNKIHRSEKRLWIFGFIFFNFLTSIFYLGKRSRIVN